MKVRNLMHYFKFYPNVEYKIKEVTGFYMYASCLENLNDPYEGSIRNIKILKPLAQEVKAQCYRRHITCLSHSETNAIVFENDYMWDLYANRHKGFCIEFNEQILNGLESLTDNTDASHLYNIYVDVQYGPNVLCIDRIDNAHSIIDILGHKLDKWEREQETRLIYRNIPIKPKRGVFSNGNLIGQLVPIKAREKAICAIYLGRLASLEQLKPVVTFADKYNIPCYKMELSMKRVRV